MLVDASATRDLLRRLVSSRTIKEDDARDAYHLLEQASQFPAAS
jgi:hypothetical protein